MSFYIHYSDDPDLVVTPEKMNRENILGWWKPAGLWFSHDKRDGWRNWCNKEQFGRRPYRYKIKLAKSAKILRMSNVEHLRTFTDSYGYNPMLGKKGEELFEKYAINWDRIRTEYQGVTIFPYIYAARFGLDDKLCGSWYYPWDCASGCVWDANAIRKVEKAGRSI